MQTIAESNIYIGQSSVFNKLHAADDVPRVQNAFRVVSRRHYCATKLTTKGK